MRKILISILIICLSPMGLTAQSRSLTGANRPLDQAAGGLSNTQTETENRPRSTTIEHHVKNWQLKELGSFSDTIAVDTLSTGFQVHSPAFRKSPVNVQLGNLGAPSQPAMVSEMSIRNDFLFAKNLSYFFDTPENWRYYNTRTPYTNLYYQYGGPKRRSEEAIGVLFTQNINKRWNAGFDYKVISSIGKYEAQRVENRNFRFFSSYSGLKYEVHGSYVYNKTDQLENGGIEDDDYIFNPGRYNFDQKESIPVNFYSASNRIDNHQLYVNQALRIGNLTVSRRDTESVKLPLGTAIHTFHLNRNRRNHRIDNLSRAIDTGADEFFYKGIYIDSTATRDLIYHTSVKNSFQLKFNEEANELLKFGLRVFVTNEIENLQYPKLPEQPGTHSTPPVYMSADSTFANTHLGGQIFKNLGERFRWNAGMRFYFQGYRTGDSELTGAISSSFKVANDTAGLFANGGLFLTTPSFFESRYTSNHFIWDERFNQTKTLKVRGGLKIPTRRAEISVEGRFINDYIYWNQEAMPTQTNAYLKLIELKLFKHFSLGNFHNRNTVLYQISSHQDIVPLPQWAIYSSIYYENTLFDVLFVQLGFDVRYTSLWYAPAYMPATGQFHAQNERKVGNYPFVDAFLNMQLKRARIFIKMDHVNEGFPDNNYFHTINYPANPRGLRFGVSWNFYD